MQYTTVDISSHTHIHIQRTHTNALILFLRLDAGRVVEWMRAELNSLLEKEMTPLYQKNTCGCNTQTYAQYSW